MMGGMMRFEGRKLNEMNYHAGNFIMQQNKNHKTVGHIYDISSIFKQITKNLN